MSGFSSVRVIRAHFNRREKRSGARKPSQTGNRLLRACTELDETGVLQDEMCYIRYYALTEDDLRFLRWFMSHFILIFNFISFLRAIALQISTSFSQSIFHRLFSSKRALGIDTSIPVVPAVEICVKTVTASISYFNTVFDCCTNTFLSTGHYVTPLPPLWPPTPNPLTTPSTMTRSPPPRPKIPNDPKEHQKLPTTYESSVTLQNGTSSSTPLPRSHPLALE